jgi:hypothetical protein
MTIKSHNITIDSSVLFGIMKDAELIKKDMKLEDFDSSNKQRQWKSILKFGKLAGKNCVFTGTINTDGICLYTQTHFKRPVKESTKGEITLKDTDRVIGVDPGRVNIFYGVEKLKNNKVKEFVLTRKQYYNDSGIYKARDQTEKWTKDVQPSLNQLSQVSTKGFNLQKHNEYMNVYHKVKESLWTEYTKPRWSRQRFRLYGGL